MYEARLENVEHGEVICAIPPSIRLDRIRKPLTRAISDGFDKKTAFEHIVAGLEQLRTLNLGHGDIKINNIFVDDDGVAFLDDLEYCAPLGSIILKVRTTTSVKTIKDFDFRRIKTCS